MTEFETIRIFVKVVQAGSFSKAAGILQLPKSTVSRAVSRLENETGTKLMMRTTRSLTLTASGRAFYESCLGPVQTLEDARKSLQGKDGLAVGLIRLTGPEDLGQYVITPEIAKLARRHAGLSFQLLFTDEVLDLVKDGVDLAIRLGKLRSSQLKQRKLGEVVIWAVAAPEYLKRGPRPIKPEDLSAHDCLGYGFRDGASRGWAFRTRGQRSVVIQPRTRVNANQMSSLVDLAVRGAGIAFVPSYLCEKELRSGRLERVLPDWEGPRFPVWMVSPSGLANSARIKLVSDALGDAIRAALAQAVSN